VEGALAPDPSAGGSKTEPLRELPGARKRERSWRDEVRERVRHRRRERTGGELPLFPEEDTRLAEARPAPPVEEPTPAETDAPVFAFEDDPPLDLPLRETPDHEPSEAAPERAASRFEPAGRFEELAPDDMPLAEEELADLPRIDSLRAAVERPARPLERAQAALVDLGLLVGMWALVVYFAGRAAHTDLAGLAQSWPWLLAFLAGLGLAYATYFTGVTGQTLGKLTFGLRVVKTDGQPPGPLVALGRAALAVVGIAAAFAGLLPIVFDPAKRALHDRLLRTRVIKG
jgi:uncharacterized RDD family membrane protein YckC